MRTSGRRTAAGIILVAVLALAGCGDGKAGAGAAAAPSPNDAQLEVLVNNLVQCIRQHGAPGMPDVPVRNGHIVLPDKNTVDQATQQNVPAARQACKSVEDRIPPGVLDDPRDQSSGPTAADVPKLREFAKCMRGNGEPDWPDPKADGSFPGQDLRQGKTPQFRAAIEACRQYWDGPMRFTP